MDRDQGFRPPNRGRSGGRAFPRSAAQPRRPRNNEPGWASMGKQGNLVYVPKRSEGQSSSEPTSDVSSEAKSSNASEEINTSPMSRGRRAETRQIPAEFKTDNENETIRCDLLPIKDDDVSRERAETRRPFYHGGTSFGISTPKTPASDGKSEKDGQPGVFDIYQAPRQTRVPKLNRSLLETNREKRANMQHSVSEFENEKVLRPGMVLLKGYIPLSEQVKIVERCRELGIGPGGFYQPGYGDGAKLHLKLMCLGKNWDPDTGRYGDHRPSDGSKPPDIPAEFYQLVKNAIEDSNSAIKRETNNGNPTKLLPWMTPDICLANFYYINGRLGLHQDRDESQESIRKGLPVVSFSIGDSADFLYGDKRDVEKADTVVLESGDVLIFGGDSRSVFHGVTTIHQKSAPEALLELTNLRPGRLNLTFRQY